MTSIREAVRRMFQPPEVLPAGMYHYQAPLDDPRNIRLHLRLEPDGTGMLVVNASTVLHLNQSAAEYAYHLVHQSSEEEVSRQVSKRYRVSRDQALADFRDFAERIDLLIDRQDLDPEIFLDFDPTTRSEVSVPIRVDAALTSRTPPNTVPALYPSIEESEEMTTMEWRQVLDKAWHAGILQVIFTGGEPTLRDDLLDLIRHTEENGQVAGLVTDGILIKDKEYLNAVLQSGLDHIVILFDPGQSEIWRIIDSLVAADIFITIHLTFTNENKSDMEAAVGKLVETGIHALSMSYSDPELAETVRAARDLVADSNVPFVWGLPIPNPGRDLESLIPESGDDSQYAVGLFIAPNGDTARSAASGTFAGNFYREPWDAIWSRLNEAG